MQEQNRIQIHPFNILLSLMSHVVGIWAQIKWPRPIQRFHNRLFVFFTGIQAEQAEHPIDSYPSIEELFTRRLRAGIRPIAGTCVSPADGTLLYSQAVIGMQHCQAKGNFYRLDHLALGREGGSDFMPGWCSSIYLAPHNYHRVHSPIAGRLLSATHIPGEHWSVSERCVRWIPRLYTRNERLSFCIEVSNTQGQMEYCYVVMVGALNVAKMECPYLPQLRTHVRHQEPQIRQYTVDQPLQAGDELGIFLMGSTVVVLWPRSAAQDHNLMEINHPKSILMGASLSET